MNYTNIDLLVKFKNDLGSKRIDLDLIDSYDEFCAEAVCALIKLAEGAMKLETKSGEIFDRDIHDEEDLDIEVYVQEVVSLEDSALFEKGEIVSLEEAAQAIEVVNLCNDGAKIEHVHAFVGIFKRVPLHKAELDSKFLFEGDFDDWCEQWGRELFSHYDICDNAKIHIDKHFDFRAFGEELLPTYESYGDIYFQF